MTVTVDQQAHDATAYTKTYNKTPAETAQQIADETAAQQASYRSDALADYDEYRRLTGIANVVPTISSLSPNTHAADGSAFPVTVTGTGFMPYAQVNWNGVLRPTVWNSATSLTVTPPAVLSAGVVPIRVTNGGVSTSAATNFTYT